MELTTQKLCHNSRHDYESSILVALSQSTG
jgi:hypothetical protein